MDGKYPWYILVSQGIQQQQHEQICCLKYNNNPVEDYDEQR